MDILLNYWAQEIRPEDKLHLVIIGDGPEKENLQELSNTLGISDTVTFTGRIEHADLPPCVASGDIYVTASLSDTNSISMLEGMAAGLPVLQRYDELNKEQIRDGENGYVFHSSAEMAEELRRVSKMSAEELKILKSSVRRSVNNSGAQNLANYICDIYTRILNKQTDAAK